MTTQRVTKEDLDAAILWLESYENAPGEDTGERCQKVADWLKVEKAKREIARVAREHNVSFGVAKRAIAAALAQEEDKQ